MGVALTLIGILAILAGIIMFIIALVRKRGWGIVRSLVLGGVGIVLLIVGTAVGVGEEAEKAGTTEVGKSRFNPVPLGSSLTYQEKRVTVLDSERLYRIGYDRAEEERIFLIVTIKVDFLGDPQGKKHYLSTLNYRVVGSRGVIYDEEWFPETENPLEGGEFYGGASTSGDLVYEVEEEETNFALIWNCAFSQDRYFEIP